LGFWSWIAIWLWIAIFPSSARVLSAIPPPPSLQSIQNFLSQTSGNCFSHKHNWSCFFQLKPRNRANAIGHYKGWVPRASILERVWFSENRIHMASAPCVTAVAHPLDMAQPAITVPQAATTLSGSAPPLSFAAPLAGTTVIDDRPFPTPCIKGDALSIKIYQEEFRKGVKDCRKVLRARLILNKGDKPYFARDLNSKIRNISKTSAGWKMVPIGKGFYDFHFESRADLKKIWADGTVHIKPGLLRFSQWTKDFKLLKQKQTHVSLWIHLVEFPQEY